jgi:hypothetical protein
MTDDIERNFLDEARALLAGQSAMLCELRHLEALNEAHECVKIRIANAIEALKRDTLNGRV